MSAKFKMYSGIVVPTTVGPDDRPGISPEVDAGVDFGSTPVQPRQGA